MSHIIESYLNEINHSDLKGKKPPLYARGWQKKPIRIGPYTYKINIDSWDDYPGDGEVRKLLRRIMQSHNGYIKSAINFINDQTGPKETNKTSMKVIGFRKLMGDYIDLKIYNKSHYDIYWKFPSPVTVIEYNYKGQVHNKRKEKGIVRNQHGEFYI